MELTLEQIQDFKGKYPRQIWSLFFSEMWERFCFYGMRGMLTFFITYELLDGNSLLSQSQKEEMSNLQYGAIQAFVYAFTFVGGLFADKILGFRKSLFWGGLLMIVGSIILSIDPHQFFFLGIAFTVIGTGFFKPNISTMVGKLYKKGDSRTDAGFSLFYAGINLGALLGGYFCIAIGKGEMFSSFIPEDKRWNVAFSLAAIVMVVSLVNFIFTQRRLGPIGLQPQTLNADGTFSPMAKWKEYGVYVLSLVFVPIIITMVSKTEYTDLFMYIVGPLTLIYLFYEMTKVTPAERKKLWAALVFIIFSILFWGIYEQSGGSLSIFAAEHLDKKLLFFNADPNGINNSGGAFFVIIFAFVFSFIWLWLSKRKMEPNTIIKFGLGFIFLGLGYYLLFATKFFANLQGITSLNIFTIALLVITFGELCLSPIGLSIMTKLSTEKLQGMMMGMWFLASAYGQYVAGIIGANMASAKEGATNYEKLITYTEGYKMLGIYALVAGLVLILISPFVKKLMQEVH